MGGGILLPPLAEGSAPEQLHLFTNLPCLRGCVRTITGLYRLHMRLRRPERLWGLCFLLLASHPPITHSCAHTPHPSTHPSYIHVHTHAHISHPSMGTGVHTHAHISHPSTGTGAGQLVLDGGLCLPSIPEQARNTLKMSDSPLVQVGRLELAH